MLVRLQCVQLHLLFLLWSFRCLFFSSKVVVRVGVCAKAPTGTIGVIDVT